MTRVYKRIMQRLIITIIIILTFIDCKSQDDNTWLRYLTVDEAGFSIDKLQNAKDFFDSTSAVSMMLIKNGYVVTSWGNIERRYKCHSVRKSLLNSLYGVQIKNNVIDISKTIGDLDIKEKIELTEQEKSAKIKHLLSTRSGVYLDAALQPDVGDCPERGKFKPDENQYYNNWDFNVLGTIYNKETQSDIFIDFKKYIAVPLGMEDYREFDGTYEYENISLHPGYPIKMSTRDLAKFGQLYLQMGNWKGKQIFDTTWIEQSMTPYTRADNMGNAATGYGYLWWIQERQNEPKRYFAHGWGEQYLGVFPNENIVIVIRSDSYSGNYFIEEHREKLIKLLLESNQTDSKKSPKLVTLETCSNKLNGINLSKSQLTKYVDSFKIEQNNIPETNSEFRIKMANNMLIIEGLHYAYKFGIIPLTENRFFIEDIELFLEFEQDGDILSPKISTY